MRDWLIAAVLVTGCSVNVDPAPIVAARPLERAHHDHAADEACSAALDRLPYPEQTRVADLSATAQKTGSYADAVAFLWALPGGCAEFVRQSRASMD
jgi:hypothetical protein